MGGRHSKPQPREVEPMDRTMHVSVVDSSLRWIYCHHNDDHTCFVQERKIETSPPWTLLT